MTNERPNLTCLAVILVLMMVGTLGLFLCSVPQKEATHKATPSEHLKPAPVASKGEKGIPGSGDATRRPPVQQVPLAQLPLHFLENQGQVHEKVRYYVKETGQDLFFTEAGVVFTLSRSEPHDTQAGFQSANYPAKRNTSRIAFGLEFVGANQVRPQGVAKERARVNCFVGPRENWRTDIPTYREIVYRNLYPGIDLVYTGTSGKLKYEFLVKPGAEPGRILLAYNGIESLRVSDAGSLLIDTPFGTLSDARPYAYQMIDGKEVEVAAVFSLNPKSKIQNPNFSYGFEVTSYDPNHPLIIDPTLDYSTYLGGSGDDRSRKIAVDGSSGDVYVSGVTASSDFPTQNAFQPSYGGGSWDVFVTKLDSTGALSYSTYLGGSGEEGRSSESEIAVDGSGNVYLTGYTTSDDFPTVNAIQATRVGGWDVFVTKLDSTGALSYSTYLGGSLAEGGWGIDVDAAGNMYVGGRTESVDFPTANAFQPTNQGGGAPAPSDVFVTKLNAAGDTLAYSTFLGGTQYDHCMSLAVDGSGSAYVTGHTWSSDFPTTAGAYQLAKAGAATAYDNFVSKFDASGNLVYSTYLGGTDYEWAQAIAINGSGNAYVTGETRSSDFPTTTGAYDTTFNGGFRDAFVTKLSVGGDGLDYSTYLGAGDFDMGHGIALDSSGNAYVTGYTSSITFPTLNPIQANKAGNEDCFVTVLNPAGNDIIFSTYLGGGVFDLGRGIEVDNSGGVYITGESGSNDFPTQNPFQGAHGDGGVSNDGFVTKLRLLSPGAYNVNISTGSDATGDGSSGNPWKTLHFSISEINKGLPGSYTLNVAAGTYNVTNGEDDSPLEVTTNGLTIYGAGAGTTIIDSGGVVPGPGAWEKGVSATAGVPGFEIYDISITGFSYRGIDLYGIAAPGIVIERCIVSQNNDQGVYIEGSAQPISISDCTVNDNTWDGIAIVSCSGSTTDIARNTIYDNGDRGIALSECDPVVVNNLIYESATGAMAKGIDCSVIGSPPDPAIIYHNTIDGGSSNGIYVDSSSTVTIQYNIIANFGDYGIYNDTGTVTIDYNNVWNNSPDDYNGCSAGTNDISDDPLYVGGGDYHLQTAPFVSPCIDVIPGTAGDPVTDDLAGDPRPVGVDDKDIGCYETISGGTTYTLIVLIDPAGGGTVSDGGSIDCPASFCSDAFADGTSVTLTATPLGGYVFDYWEETIPGGATGIDGSTSAVETFSITDDIELTAHFIASSTYNLTVSISPPGAGSVSLNPPGGVYAPATVVTLTANAASGYEFGQWTGSLGGSANPETITMDGNKNVTAQFNVLPPPPAANLPPVLNPIGDKTVSEGSLLAFNVSGSDPDGDPLSFSASGLPAGASFSGQTFSWQPGFTQAGAHRVTFSVTDGEFSDSETITITVMDVNQPPTLDPIGDKTIDENELLEFEVSATDPDGDPLLFSIENLPEGASFDGFRVGQIFSWTPDYDQSGTYEVTFSVSDNQRTDSETITITVLNVTDPPILTPIGDKTINEGQLLTFGVLATDPDGDPLTYEADPLPQGASFSGQTFSWTPEYTQAGTYEVTFSVSDGVATVGEDVTITVTDNAAPQMAPIGTIQGNEGDPIRFQVNATDPNGDPLTYAALNLPQGAAFNAETHTFQWTPAIGQAGSYQVECQVSDGEFTVSDIVAIEVAISVPEVPELPGGGTEFSPVAGSTGNSPTDIVFSWPEAPYAQTYTLIICADPECSVIVLEVRGLTEPQYRYGDPAPFVAGAGLSPYEAYYMSVTAQNMHGEVPYPTVGFATGPPPPGGDDNGGNGGNGGGGGNGGNGEPSDGTVTMTSPPFIPYADVVYQMISIPLRAENQHPSALLGDDLGPYNRSVWRLFRYDSTDGEYHEYPHVPAMEPGYAFWLIADQRVEVDAEGWPVSTEEDFAITIPPGFFQLGCPFYFPVSWESVKVKSGNVTVLIGDPANEWISPFLQKHEDEGYVLTDVLEPWGGCWVENVSTVEVEILIPPVMHGAGFAD